MNVAQPEASTSALAHFASVWASGLTATDTAPALTCTELDALLELLATAGAPDAAARWIAAHTRQDEECEGHTVPDVTPAPVVVDEYDEDGNYTPAPGIEYPFAVSDIARTVARLLGKGWTAESGAWGTTGTLSGPQGTSFTFSVDYEGDLLIQWDSFTDDNFPENPTLPEDFAQGAEGVYLVLACSADGLDRIAEQYADAIRAITGYDPAKADAEKA